MAQQAARSPALPQPSGAGREESLPFMLDLQNLPGLANVDLSAQNPNIQVWSGSGKATGGVRECCGESDALQPHLVP